VVGAYDAGRDMKNIDDPGKAERLVSWTKRKIRTHFAVQKRLYFEEREIWWSSLGENIGVEINGKHDVFERPVVVVRKLCTDLLLVIPITTKSKIGSWFFLFLFEGSPRIAVLAQVRVISSKRLIRRMGVMTADSFSALQDALITVIIKRSPDFRQGSSDPSASDSRH
jgi:mRNA interferase MazF